MAARIFRLEAALSVVILSLKVGLVGHETGHCRCVRETVARFWWSLAQARIAAVLLVRRQGQVIAAAGALYVQLLVDPPR